MEMKNLVNDYISWLKAEITTAKNGDYIEVTTPYLDRYNDYLQIYVRQNPDGKLFLTDDGYILNNLISSGVNLSSPKRQSTLEMILRRYGVTLKGREITTTTSAQTFPKKKHLLLQAMLTTDDLFLISQGRVASYFLEDIEAFFTEKDIYCTENVSFQGQSGFTHIYDYILQRSKNMPERLCHALNAGTKSNMERILFSWEDTREIRRNDSKLIVLLNDENHVERGVLDGFSNYNVNVIKWSERESNASLALLRAVA